MPPARRSLALAALAGAALLWSAPSARAQAEDVEARDQIVLSGDVNVPQGEQVGEVVVIHGTVTVSGVVRGDVVVLDGPVRVFGQVAGAVVAVDGRVVLGPTAQVGGDVLSGEEVIARPGAQVGGATREGVRFSLSGPLRALGRFLGWLAVSVSTLLLGLFLVFVAPRAADAIADAVRTAPLPSAGWGLAVCVMTPVWSVALLVSILGLPLGVALVLALLLLAMVGYTWSVWAIGRLLLGPERNRALALLAGWAIARAVGAVPFVDAATWLLGAVLGLGAMTVATWRARRMPGKHRVGRAAVLAPVGAEEEPGTGWD